MEKGFLIMLITFVVIAVIHIATLNLMKLPEQKKAKSRKIYWYIYGVYFLGYGIYLNLSKGMDITGILFIVLAIAVIVMNAIGKIESKNQQT